MGSTEQDELTVLVTGFAPFKEQYPINPSWEIANSLPKYLPPLRAKAPGTGSSIATPPVRLLVYPHPVKVAYSAVRELVPRLWAKADEERTAGGSESILGGGDGTNTTIPTASSPSPTAGIATVARRKIDLAIHIGMAGPRLFYSIERRGHRDGYNMPDVDGEVLGDEKRRAQKRGEHWVWEDMPPQIETDFDLDDVLDRWRLHSPKKADLRISEDAGHYLCDFIYFSSLSQLVRQDRAGKVVFLHVPADASVEAVSYGTELTLQLIRSLVESELASRAVAVETGRGTGEGGKSEEDEL